MPLSYVRVLILASSVLASCGGGTPPPKDESDAVEHGSSKSDKESKEATDSPNAAPSAPAAASEPASAPPATKSSSGDLVAPQADDPWMAPHQMPAGDVIKTIRAALGKVNACWRAAKKRDSSIAGEVKIKFVITHEGSVRVWRNEDSTMSDEEAIKCVGEILKTLRFPTQKSPGDAWGIYAITFGG
jgi:outer membrane biosynthesis protein TonB